MKKISVKTFYEEALLKLGLTPQELGVQVTVYGFLGVRVEGCKSVAEYSSETVKVRGKKEIEIKGKNLVLSEIAPGEVFIKGQIFSISADCNE